MSFPLHNSAPPISSAIVDQPTGEHRAELEARRVAEEFESIFMAQLTAPLGPSEDGGEDDLFGSDATNMYRRMFGEQMAGSLAKGGGIGLADMILTQLRGQKDSSPQLPSHLTRALDAARAVRGGEAGMTAMPAASIEKLPIANVSTEHVAPTTEHFNATRPRRVHAAAVDSVIDEHSHPREAQLPVEGRISSHFGVRRDPVHGRHRFHNGVDIAAAKGSPIGAMGAGTVVFAGWQGGYGNTVVIEHADGRQSRYAHADKLLVKQGETVEAGQTIATVGSTGRSTGAHLHFEVSEQGRRVDPLRALAHDLQLARR